MLEVKLVSDRIICLFFSVFGWMYVNKRKAPDKILFSPRFALFPLPGKPFLTISVRMQAFTKFQLKECLSYLFFQPYLCCPQISLSTFHISILYWPILSFFSHSEIFGGRHCFPLYSLKAPCMQLVIIIYCFWLIFRRILRPLDSFLWLTWANDRSLCFNVASQSLPDLCRPVPVSQFCGS